MSKKISALPAATDVTNADFPIVQGGVNKKAAANLIAAPIYSVNNIPVGDGTTAGGIANSSVSADFINHFYAYGGSALSSQTGVNDVIGIGQSAGNGQSGSNVIGIGNGAANSQSGDNAIGIGQGSIVSQSGNNVIGIGNTAANTQSGSEVIAIGSGAGQNQSGSNVICLGFLAGEVNGLSGMFIIANTELTAYADRATAEAAITVGNGAAAGNTYLYWNTALGILAAVRL